MSWVHLDTPRYASKADGRRWGTFVFLLVVVMVVVVGGGKGLNVRHCVHQFVRGITPLPSPLPYPSFLPLPPSSRPIDEQWFTNKQKPPPMSRQNAMTSWPINWNYHHPPPLQPSLSPPPALPTTVIWGRAHHGNVFLGGGGGKYSSVLCWSPSFFFFFSL